MANIGIYNSEPTEGHMDGLLVTAENPIMDGELQIGANREGDPIKLAVRCLVNGNERVDPYPFSVTPVGPNADRWALAPDNNGVPGAWGAWGDPLLIPGVDQASAIEAINTIFWAKPRVLAGETIPGGLTVYDDLSVSFEVPDNVTEAAALLNTPPQFIVGPRALNVDETSFDLDADFMDYDGDPVTAKYLVKTVNVVPTSGEWDAASAFAGPSVAITGRTADTDYFCFIRLNDGNGHLVVSDVLEVRTMAEGVNARPTFDGTNPRVKAGSITDDGWVIECGAADADGDTITHRLAIDGGAFGVVTPTLNGTSGLYELAVAGKDATTQYTFQIRLEDAGHTGGAGLTSAGVQVTTDDPPNTQPDAFTPTVSAISSTGCTVTAATTDPESDTMTFKVAVTASATPPVDWSGYADKTEAEMAAGVVIDSLTPSTAYYAHVQASDGTDTTVGTSAQFNTTASGWGTPVFSDDFNTATVGQVPAGWVHATASPAVEWAVQEGGPNGNRALRAPIRDSTSSPLSSQLVRAFTGLTSGTVRHYITGRTGTLAANTRHGSFNLRKTAGAVPATGVAIKDQKIQVTNNGAWTDLVAAASNTNYAIIVEFRFSDKKYRVSVNGTWYDNAGSWYSCTADMSALTAIDQVLIENYSPTETAGQYAWVDDVSVAYQ